MRGLRGMGPQQTKKNGDFGDAAPKQNKKCLEMPPTPLCPSQGLHMDASLGKITSYTMLSCTVTCSRQNPACAVQCCAYMRSTVQYSTGQIWNVKLRLSFHSAALGKCHFLNPSRNWHFSREEAAEIKWSMIDWLIVSFLVSEIDLPSWKNVGQEQFRKYWIGNVRRCEKAECKKAWPEFNL